MSYDARHVEWLSARGFRLGDSGWELGGEGGSRVVVWWNGLAGKWAAMDGASAACGFGRTPADALHDMRRDLRRLFAAAFDADELVLSTFRRPVRNR